MGSCMGRSFQKEYQDTVCALKEVESARVQKLQELQNIYVDENEKHPISKTEDSGCQHEDNIELCSNFGCKSKICHKCAKPCSICSVYKCQYHAKICQICREKYVCCDNDCRSYSRCRICKKNVYNTYKGINKKASFNKTCVNCTIRIPEQNC